MQEMHLGSLQAAVLARTQFENLNPAEPWSQAELSMLETLVWDFENAVCIPVGEDFSSTGPFFSLPYLSHGQRDLTSAFSQLMFFGILVLCTFSGSSNIFSRGRLCSRGNTSFLSLWPFLSPGLCHRGSHVLCPLQPHLSWRIG